VVVLHYADGILFVAENRSQALHKVSEIYDRVAFAAVGRYNEFENLRQAGIRYADVRGYTYDRTDVTGRGLANMYAQGARHDLLVGRGQAVRGRDRAWLAGATPQQDQIYRLT
jgi:proteasome alpha subunit